MPLQPERRFLFPRERRELPGLLAPPDEGRMSGRWGGSEGALAGSKRSAERVQEAGSERQELSLHPGDSDRTEEGVPGLLGVPVVPTLPLTTVSVCRAALTEQDVEAAFTHLALAFSCDAFTLRQRLEVEERARAAAEDNVQQELGQCQDALERLGRSCAAADAQQALEQLQRGLTVLAAAVARATSAAEKLGAVHQEARMGRAAEVMVQHVENLKRQHVREHAELEDMKRLIQQNSRNRQLGETQDEAEPRPRPHALTRSFPQASARRRVSIAVIPKQLLPGASPDGRAEPAREPGAPRSEKELRRRGAMSGEPVGSSGPGTEHEEPEQPELP
ncbi:inositol 1,4,5-triphosphate receptor associated 2-like [Eudromia elegans]